MRKAATGANALMTKYAIVAFFEDTADFDTHRVVEIGEVAA